MRWFFEKARKHDLHQNIQQEVKVMIDADLFFRTIDDIEKQLKNNTSHAGQRVLVSVETPGVVQKHDFDYFEFEAKFVAKSESGEFYEEFDEAIVSNVLPADMDWNEIIRLLLQCDLNGCYSTQDEIETLHGHLNVILESDNIRSREGTKPGLGAIGGFWNVK